jgi:hypothetical protein
MEAPFSSKRLLAFHQLHGIVSQTTELFILKTLLFSWQTPPATDLLTFLSKLERRVVEFIVA